MADKSEYYNEKNKKQIEKLRGLENQLPAYVVTYLDDKEISSQINTVVAYAYDLITFFKFLTEKNVLLKGKKISDIELEFLENLTFQDINEYQKYLRYNNETDGEKHLNSDRGIARRMAPLRGFFTYANERGFLPTNPTVGASKRKKMPGKDIIRLETDEVTELIDSVANTNIKGNNLQVKKCIKTRLRDTAIITLLLNTGIRVSECVGLDLNDVNFDNQTINIVRKGGASTHLYFNETVATALTDYIENERDFYVADEKNALFISSKKSRMSVSAIERMVKKYAKNVIPDKKISPHKMRSTYGTALYKDTGDIRLVSDVLGHKDINTTAKHYAAMEEEHKKKAASMNLYTNKDTDTN